MKHLGLKFYSNDPEIGEVKDISEADFAIERVLMTIDEIKKKFPHMDFRS